MTISTSLKTANMKHLLRALTMTHRINPSPFYLLKMPVSPTSLIDPDFLFLNRTISSAAIQKHPNRFTVWSPHHLQRLQNCGITDLDKKVVISNPYKSEQFILQGLASSVKSMAISSIEEFQKIEKLRNSNSKFKSQAMNYYWTFNNEPNELENMKQLKRVIKNVIFDWSEVKQASRIQKLTRKIIQMGCSLENVICSGEKVDLEELKRWSVQGISHRRGKVNKHVEIKDVSDVDGYILAAKSRGRGVFGIDSAAQELIDVKACSTDSLMVQIQKDEWLLSKISKFPLDEQSYLYEVDLNHENEEFQIEGASLI